MNGAIPDVTVNVASTLAPGATGLAIVIDGCFEPPTEALHCRGTFTLRVTPVTGAPVVFVTPNVANLSVGAHTFWLDPSHLRPIPPDLFKFYLEVEGFRGVGIRTFEPSGQRLHEEFSDARARDNARLLNQTLFGDRDYAVVGFQPDA